MCSSARCCSGSVLALSLAAASLGTAALAAHAAALQVWMLMSYVVDGFADVGTMLGAKILGAGEFGDARARAAARRAGRGVGAARGGLAVSLDPLAHLWLAGDAAAAAALASVWPLLCAMQLPNAMVVWDGVMYASNDSLPYIRGALAVGALGVFAPALWCVGVRPLAADGVARQGAPQHGARRGRARPRPALADVDRTVGAALSTKR